MAVTVGLSLSANPLAGATQDNMLEYRVKAAFIYNFTKFINWPVEEADQEKGQLQVCVVGSPLFNDLMQETVAGKTKDNLMLSSKLIARQSEATDCQVLFLGNGDRPYLSDWVKAVAGNPILTVSEHDSFVDAGGMIQFVIVNGKIRFDINQSAVNDSQLQISSRLLSLARQVKR